MKKIIFLFCFVIILSLSTEIRSQAILNSINSNFASISIALSFATNGDTIDVLPGTHNELIDLSGFTNLTLRSSEWTNTGNNSSTILINSNNQTIIRLHNTVNSTIQGFTISNTVSGLKTGINIETNCYSNQILNNRVISNFWGIVISNSTINFNTIAGNYFQNWTYDIYALRSDNNLFKNNHFQTGPNYASIYFLAGSSHNNIISNFFTKGDSATELGGNTSFPCISNIFQSNRIESTINYGILASYAPYTKIYRNIFVNNNNDGLVLSTGSHSALVINNTFFSNASDGAYVNSTAYYSAFINNIFMSNGLNSFNYGIAYQTDDPSYTNYNNLYYNNFGGSYIYGPTIYVTNQIINQNPHIQLQYPFNITNNTSIAIDHGIIVPGVSDIYNGFAPDIGYTETIFAYPIISNASTGSTYTNLQEAVNAAQTSEHIYISANISGQKITITGKTNLTITSAPELGKRAKIESGGLTGPGILLNGNSTGIIISNLWISGWTAGGTYAISCDPSGNNKIINNIICSNYGDIYLNQSGSSNNIIASNYTFGTSAYGINISSAASSPNDNLIYSNNINGPSYGIYLVGASKIVNTKIINNAILDCSSYGIYISGPMETNLIIGNYIYDDGTASAGIEIQSAGVSYNFISENIITGFTWGIDSPNVNQYYNVICSNSISSNIHSGIRLNQEPFNIQIFSNHIFNNNQYGIYDNGNTTPNGGGSVISNNLIERNGTYGILLFDTVTNLKIINNIIKGQNVGIGFNQDAGGYKHNTISQNLIIENTSSGITIQGIFTSNYIKFNNIYSNQVGIWFVNDAAFQITTNDISLNNIYNNTVNNIFNTNNYPQFSIYSNYYGARNYAQKLISSTSPGKYDPWANSYLDFDGDFITPAIPTVNSTSNLASGKICISWAAAIDPDFASYQIYRTQLPSYSNLYDSDLLVTYPQSNLTVLTDSPPQFNEYYYYLTAKDSSDNESWYSTRIGPLSNISPVTNGVASNSISGIQYLSIQKAVDKANNGSIVYILKSASNEMISTSSNLIINDKTNISIMKNPLNPQPITLYGNSALNGILLPDSASEITVKNLTFENWYIPIFISNSINNTIENNTINCTNYIGIRIAFPDSRSNNIHSNHVNGNNLLNQGISIDSGANFTRLSSNITENAVFSGFSIAQVSNNLIVENKSISNSHSGYYLSSIACKNNYLGSNYGIGQAFGINLGFGPRSNILDNNFLFANTNNGIIINSSSNIIIISNTISDNLKDGLKLINSKLIQAEYNLINGNYSNGISIDGASATLNNIINNTIFAPNQNNGIEITGGAYENSAISNIISNHSKYAFNILLSSSNQIKYNNIFVSAVSKISNDTGVNNYYLSNNIFLITDTPAITVETVSYTEKFQIIENKWNLKGISISPNKTNIENVLPLTDLTSIFSYTWDSVNQKYNDALYLGQAQGFWIFSDKTKNNITIKGNFSKQNSLSVIPLQVGWNLIANPFAFISHNLKISAKNNNTGLLALNHINAKTLIDTRIWGWSIASQSYITVSALQPWEGYWIYAHQKSYLYINGNDQTQNNAPAMHSPLTTVNSSTTAENSWFVPLSFSVDSVYDRFNIAGVQESARDDYDILDSREAPTSPSKTVKLNFSDNLSYDIKSPIETIKVWNIEAISTIPHKDGLLTWDFSLLNQAGLAAVIVDKNSKEIIARENNGSVYITSGEGGINKDYLLKVASPAYKYLLLEDIGITGSKYNVLSVLHTKTLNIKILTLDNNIYDFGFYNLNGQQLHSERNIKGNGQIYDIDIPGQKLPIGVYFIILNITDIKTGDKDTIRKSAVIVK